MLENITTPLNFRFIADMQEAWAKELDLDKPNEYSKMFEFHVTPTFAKQYDLPVGARAIKFGSTIYGYSLNK